jgi:hypothetical protein
VTTNLERFRERLAAAGALIPEAILPLVAVMAGPMLAGLDALADFDAHGVEPFRPAERLMRDAQP